MGKLREWYAEMDNINIFDNSTIIMMRKTPSKIFVWIVVIIIGLIVFLSLSIFYRYNKYLNYIGTIVEEDTQYYIKIFIEEDKLVAFSNNILLIDNKEIEYKVKNISKNYYLTPQSVKMHEVVLKCKLNQQLMIDNNMVQLRFKMPQTTAMHDFIENIKKELS